jgi:hypothetical protein
MKVVSYAQARQATQAAQAAQTAQAAQATQATQLATYAHAVAAAQAAQAAQLATYANAVTAAQKAKYIQTLAFLQNLAFFNAVAQQQAAKAAAQLVASAPAGGNTDATSTNTPHWACIRQHESSGNYSVGNGGAYQFEFGTWHGLTGLPAPAQDYPPAVQDAAALKLFSERGWEPWTTRYVCGL